MYIANHYKQMDCSMLKVLFKISLFVFQFFIVIDNTLADPVVKLSPPKQYSAGPYDFSASSATVDGVKLGYVEYGLGVQKFGPDMLTYLACDLSTPTEEMDGVCNTWKIYHLKTHKTVPLKIPRFDGRTSTPRFIWPYVAYVDTGSPSNVEKRVVLCQVYDFTKQRLMRRIKVNVSEDVFATDFPGMFLMPEVDVKHNFFILKYFVDSGSQSTPLCEIQIPTTQQ